MKKALLQSDADLGILQRKRMEYEWNVGGNGPDSQEVRVTVPGKDKKLI